MRPVIAGQRSVRSESIIKASALTVLSIVFVGLATYYAFSLEGTCQPAQPRQSRHFLWLGIRSGGNLRSNVVFEVTALGSDEPRKLLPVTSGPDGYAKLPYSFEGDGDSISVRVTYDSVEGKWISPERCLVPTRDTLVLSWKECFPGKSWFQRKKDADHRVIPAGVMEDARRHMGNEDWEDAIKTLTPYAMNLENDPEASLMYGMAIYMDDDDAYRSAEAFVKPVVLALGEKRDAGGSADRCLRERAWYCQSVIQYTKYQEADRYHEAAARMEAMRTARTYLGMYGSLGETGARRLSVEPEVLDRHVSKVRRILDREQ